jgi:uncharacterized protein YecT (DUF1311 family)
MRWKSGLIPLLVLAMSSAASSDVRAADAQDCSRFVDEVTARRCAERAAQVAQEELRQAEDSVRIRIKQWDEDQNWKQRAIQQFERSVAAFRDFQTAACDFDASAAAGGNAAGQMRNVCLTRLAKERIRTLTEQRSWFSK